VALDDPSDALISSSETRRFFRLSFSEWMFKFLELCRGWKHHSELEVVFAEAIPGSQELPVLGPTSDPRPLTKVQRASADKSVPRRVRCLLQDVLDLRKEGWKSQRPGFF